MGFSSIVFPLFAGQILIGLLGLAVALVYWIWAKLTGKKMNAKFGVISIVCFLAFVLGVAGLLFTLIIWFVGLTKKPTGSELSVQFWLPPILCALFVAISALAGFVSAIASLRKKEVPRVFGYTGLFLNALPALFAWLSLLIVTGIAVLGGLGSILPGLE